ncbi:MAG: response regulator [Chloroflexota bacterium]|nr:response regulator [Chloroflexota bacterium]
MTEKLQILIVDDDVMMTQTLVDIANKKGFEAIAACSGMEGLAIARHRKIDILLTDIKMPDMNGVELYLQVKEFQPGIKAILMTAYSAEKLIEKGLAVGVSVVLTKPVAIDFLITIYKVYQRMLASL